MTQLPRGGLDELQERFVLGHGGFKLAASVSVTSIAARRTVEGARRRGGITADCSKSVDQCVLYVAVADYGVLLFV